MIGTIIYINRFRTLEVCTKIFDCTTRILCGAQHDNNLKIKQRARVPGRYIYTTYARGMTYSRGIHVCFIGSCIENFRNPLRGNVDAKTGKSRDRIRHASLIYGKCGEGRAREKSSNVRAEVRRNRVEKYYFNPVRYSKVR